jgi:hypothetical protein
MSKNTIRLTETELIDLIKKTISEEQTSKESKEQIGFDEFMSTVKTGIGGNFEGKYKMENGRFYLKMPLPYSPIRTPFKNWVEIIVK